MIWLVGYIMLWAACFGVLHCFRSYGAVRWDVFDGAVIAALIITAVAEQAWWFGLIKHILEYNNA